MKPRTLGLLALSLVALLPAWLLLAHLGGARWLALQAAGDPGVDWIVVTETPDYRVLRDFAEPGATRRMHHHAEATWHVFTLATGTLVLTVEGEAPVELNAGQSLALKGGVTHSFTNVGTTTATIVEVFGKAAE